MSIVHSYSRGSVPLIFKPFKVLLKYEQLKVLEFHNFREKLIIILQKYRIF